MKFTRPADTHQKIACNGQLELGQLFNNHCRCKNLKHSAEGASTVSLCQPFIAPEARRNPQKLLSQSTISFNISTFEMNIYSGSR